MSATHLLKITDSAILTRISQIEHAEVEWTGMPADCEHWHPTNWRELSIARILDQLERHDLMGDTPRDEIDMAISIALEPDGLPDNAAVAVRFEDD